MLICFIALSSYFSGVSIASDSSKAIDKIAVSASSIGTGWVLKNSIYVSPQMLGQFEKTFGAKVLYIKNDIFFKNQNRLQINYIEAPDVTSASTIYQKLISMVGHANAIAQKGTIVIEIITPDVSLKKAIINVLQPDNVHTNY